MAEVNEPGGGSFRQTPTMYTSDSNEIVVSLFFDSQPAGSDFFTFFYFLETFYHFRPPNRLDQGILQKRKES